MTNALAQNIQTNENSVAIEMMIQASNVSTQTKNQEQGEFSNIINNLESKTQKLQSDFDKQAKVTNVSSINKKALDKKEPVDTKKVEKNTQNTNLISNEKKQTQKKIQTQENKKTELTKETKNEQTTNKEESNTKTIDNNVISDKTEVETKKETKNLSDINNSSPVETSPVFSSNKEVIIETDTEIETETALNEVEDNIENLINSIPVVSENVKTEIKDLKTEIENLTNNSEDIDNTIKKIEDISANINNSNLNQEQKNEITKALNEIKNTLNDIKAQIELPKNFEELLNQVSEKASKLMDGIMLEINETLSAKEATPIDLSTTIVNKEDTEAIIEQSKIIENTKLDTETLNELSNEIKTLIKDIKDAIDNKDTEKLNDLTAKIPEEIEKIDNLFNNKENEVINFDKKLVDSLKNLQNILEKNINNFETKTENSQIIEVDFKPKNNIFETLDKLSSNDFKNIDLQDKKTTKELINLLDNLDNEIEKQDLNEEIKIEIENLIKNINENKVSAKDLAQEIENLSNEIETQTKEENIDLTEDTKILDNIVEIDTFTNNQNSENETFSNKNQQNLNEYKNTAKINEYDFSELPDTDFNAEEIKLQGKTVKNIDTKNIEENLQKTIAINEMLDEMMVEVNVKTIPTQSGALSVADEVAKLAIGESNALNPITSAHGSVTYDSTGTNAIIKNVASLMKSTQAQNTTTPSMEDILNQVGNKITQLKDSSNQKLTMVLRPNDLGRLSIELTQNQNGLITQIMAQNDDVRAYIERNIDSLRQQLTEAGVNVNSIQIKTAGADNSTTYDGNQNLAREQQENPTQQNNKDGKNSQQQNQNNKNASEILSAMSNYDMQFTKDFSSIMNKSLNYGVN